MSLSYLEIYHDTNYDQSNNYFKDICNLNIVEYWHNGCDILTEFKQRIDNLADMKAFGSPDYEDEYNDVLNDYMDVEQYLRHIELYKSQYSKVKQYTWCLDLIRKLNKFKGKIEYINSL